MKKLIVLGILCSIPAIIFFGCKHEPVLPEQEVSFSQDIMPIIQMGCQHEGCHGDSLNPEFPLTTYEEVMEEGDIKPGDPLDSDLYERITETDPDKIMPRPPYPPLNDRNIKLIYIWIAQGAKNN
jgi:hypothetical protein